MDRRNEFAEWRGVTALKLKKAGRGEPRAWDYGRYWLVDAARNTLVFPDEHGASLDDLERYLTQA